MYAAPDDGSQRVGFLTYPYLVVFERTADGWLYVWTDALEAEAIDPGYETAWISPDAYVQQLGPCDDLPVIP